MNKLLAIAVVLGMASVSVGDGNDEWFAGEWLCDRDNFNINIDNQTNWNFGASPDGRVAKDMQEGTWYADWHQNDLNDLAAWLTLPPPYPYTAWEVRLGLTGAMWDEANPELLANVEAFSSLNDWNEGTGVTGNEANMGACHDYADASVDPPIPWLDENLNEVDFWSLPATPNTQQIVGWEPSTGPGDLANNRVVLDLGVVYELIADPDCRGLRTWGAGPPGQVYGYWNESCYALTQWSPPPENDAAARLMLYAVPEPATVSLVIIGAALLALRRRRAL